MIGSKQITRNFLHRSVINLLRYHQFTTAVSHHVKYSFIASNKIIIDAFVKVEKSTFEFCLESEIQVIAWQSLINFSSSYWSYRKISFIYDHLFPSLSLVLSSSLSLTLSLSFSFPPFSPFSEVLVAPQRLWSGSSKFFWLSQRQWIFTFVILFIMI